MVTIQQQLQNNIQEIISKVITEPVEVSVSRTELESHGDYSTSVAMQLAGRMRRRPMEIAGEIKTLLLEKKLGFIERIEVVEPGFINFWLSGKALLRGLDQDVTSSSKKLASQKIMVEFAHPNTHKEMHIGHMRTLITGESIARILEYSGAEVFRANYQGDIGLHVAKALYGIQQLMQEEDLSLEKLEKLPSHEKAHFLGKGYARGSAEYEFHKEEIDQINADLYAYVETHPANSLDKTNDTIELYKITRQWSLDYYHDFYRQFYTSFDRLFFESEMVNLGKKIVREHEGDVFEEDNGAVIFPGEKYGLHTRVFITGTGFPTYEGKDIGNAFRQYETFPFDRNIHVVASEQEGYFKVVFQALALIDPEKFFRSQYHLSMGMVQLKDRKMSSRTGEVFTVDSLIQQVRERVGGLVTNAKASLHENQIDDENRSETIEEIVIGSIKYSVLKTNTKQNAIFDIETSVSLDGNSGPYLQYTYARTRSILRKRQAKNEKLNVSEEINQDERSLLRWLLYFPEIIEQAAATYEPSHIATYLFELAQKFNLFYQKHKVIGSEQEEFRLVLTASVGVNLRIGLNLLGIKTVESM